MPPWNWNECTRPMCDASSYESRAHAVNTRKPLQYFTSYQHPQVPTHTGPYDVQAETALRSNPTRLNEGDHPSTELFGTAPLKRRHNGNPTTTDQETRLMYGVSTSCKSTPSFEDRSGWWSNYIKPPVMCRIPPSLGTTPFPASTRADVRNRRAPGC
eukprot:265988-Prorocentrum_minimum.AAC.12